MALSKHTMTTAKALSKHKMTTAKALSRHKMTTAMALSKHKMTNALELSKHKMTTAKYCPNIKWHLQRRCPNIKWQLQRRCPNIKWQLQWRCLMFFNTGAMALLKQIFRLLVSRRCFTPISYTGATNSQPDGFTRFSSGSFPHLQRLEPGRQLGDLQTVVIPPTVLNNQRSLATERGCHHCAGLTTVEGS